MLIEVIDKMLIEVMLDYIVIDNVLIYNTYAYSSVGMQTEGIEVRSVGNTLTLHKTALIEAFNLKAAIEYLLKNQVVILNISKSYCISIFQRPYSHQVRSIHLSSTYVGDYTILYSMYLEYDHLLRS